MDLASTFSELVVVLYMTPGFAMRTSHPCAMTKLCLLFNQPTSSSNALNNAAALIATAVSTGQPQVFGGASPRVRPVHLAVVPLP